MDIKKDKGDFKMIVEKINSDNKTMVINLLKNVNGLKIEDKIIDNCLVLLNDKYDICGCISYEKYDNYGLIRYFVFKRNIEYTDLLLLYQSLEIELKKVNIKESIAIINSDEVKEVFKQLGFNKIDKDKVYFEETVFSQTNYNENNEIYVKKIN